MMTNLIIISGVSVCVYDLIKYTTDQFQMQYALQKI